MNQPEIEAAMSSLQGKMDNLQVKEAEAHKRKIEAENEIAACNNYWFAIYQEYQSLKDKLQKLNP